MSIFFFNFAQIEPIAGIEQGRVMMTHARLMSFMILSEHSNGDDDLVYMKKRLWPKLVENQYERSHLMPFWANL